MKKTGLRPTLRGTGFPNYAGAIPPVPGTIIKYDFEGEAAPVVLSLHAPLVGPNAQQVGAFPQWQVLPAGVASTQGVNATNAWNITDYPSSFGNQYRRLQAAPGATETQTILAGPGFFSDSLVITIQASGPTQATYTLAEQVGGIFNMLSTGTAVVADATDMQINKGWNGTKLGVEIDGVLIDERATNPLLNLVVWDSVTLTSSAGPATELENFDFSSLNTVAFT